MSLDITLYTYVNTGNPKPYYLELFSENYTHNCSPMAKEAHIYSLIWHPNDHLNITVAENIIEPLKKGIQLMEKNPNKYITLNPPNGWGDYDSFLFFLKQYLKACQNHPKVLVKVSR